MAGESSQEPTEKASPKRIRDARKEGQVPRSRELSSALVVGSAMLLLVTAGGAIVRGAVDLMRDALSFSPEMLGEPERMPVVAGKRIIEGMSTVAPLMLVTLVAALLGPMLLGGWNFASKGFAPDFSRLSPLAGIKRLFGMQGFVEMIKSLLKIVLIGAVCGGYLWGKRDALTMLAAEDLQSAVLQVGRLCAGMLGWATGVLLLLALFDAPYQRWSYLRRLRMTKEQIKQEYKQSEGSPEVKGRIRRLQHEMANRRMMQAVPTADVVITNPTHYAVALKYSVGKMRAPRVVAKGAGEVAAAIRQLARDNKVPLVSAPPLARALYRSVELEQDIPGQLYSAVAQVLVYVHQLRHWRSGPMPTLAPVGDVPGGEPDAQ